MTEGHGWHLVYHRGNPSWLLFFLGGGFKSKATQPELANKKGKFTDPNGDLKGVQPIDKNIQKQKNTWWGG